jgi:4-alpha-glucanotransferase
MLPLGPTGYGNSPYQSFSAFAGSSLLISLEMLADEGLLSTADLPASTFFPADTVAYEEVGLQQTRMLNQAYERFRSPSFANQQHDLAVFADQQSDWLDDYSLFQAVKWAHGGVAWTSWEPKARDRDPEALRSYREQLRQQIELEKFAQFKFYQQWLALKRYANERGISVIGDLPIFVAHDSADVWVNKEQFYLNPDGRPQVVAGVPPDYFSATGQLWGNPIYRWDKMASENYAWWINRIRGALQLYDRIRIDHFRGFSMRFGSG